MDNKSGAQEVDDLRDEDSMNEAPGVEAEIDALPDGDTQSSPTVSVIGKSVVFKGELTAAEDLLVHGRIKGSLKNSAPNLTIGPDGKVDADIDANGVVVQGTVRGDIRGKESVVVEPSARVRGNLYAPVIGLKEGARFKGRIDMDPGARHEGPSELAGLGDERGKPPPAKKSRRARRKASARREAQADAAVAEEILEESE